MTINITRHKTILFQILKEIYTNTKISPYLGFKGGTAALLFHGLDRFSVDLDFDLNDENQSDIVFEELLKIIEKFGSVKETYKKRFSLFFMIFYEDKSRNIKIEINKRQFGSKYEIKSYLGVSMQVMLLEDMVANKLLAMYERMDDTSRDIYDVWYFLKTRSPINKAIVENRSGQPFDEVVKRLIRNLEKFEKHRILLGLGELLTPNQKDWARANLIDETISYLNLLLS
jgi:predicted nucleotidyltransferase component of viral defense system